MRTTSATLRATMRRDGLSLYELDAMLDEATVDAAIVSWETDSAAVRRSALRHAVRNVPVAVE